jgi:hypothetical protein
MTSKRQVSSEEGKALADEVGAIGWIEVSSLTGVNGKLPCCLITMMIVTKLSIHRLTT